MHSRSSFLCGRLLSLSSLCLLSVGVHNNSRGGRVASVSLHRDSSIVTADRSSRSYATMHSSRQRSSAGLLAISMPGHRCWHHRPMLHVLCRKWIQEKRGTQHCLRRLYMACWTICTAKQWSFAPRPSTPSRQRRSCSVLEPCEMPDAQPPAKSRTGHSRLYQQHQRREEHGSFTIPSYLRLSALQELPANM